MSKDSYGKSTRRCWPLFFLPLGVIAWLDWSLVMLVWSQAAKRGLLNSSQQTRLVFCLVGVFAAWVRSVVGSVDLLDLNLLTPLLHLFLLLRTRGIYVPWMESAGSVSPTFLVYWSFTSILHSLPRCAFFHCCIPLPLRQGCLSFCPQISVVTLLTQVGRGGQLALLYHFRSKQRLSHPNKGF